MKILLVEDDKDFAQRCTERLLAAKYEVSYETDAVAARCAIADDEYDLIIIDLMLPPTFGLEGLDLLKHLRMDKQSTRTIMITSKACKTTNIVAEAMKLGAADFLDKDDPCFLEKLVVAIKESKIPCASRQSGRSPRHSIAYLIFFLIIVFIVLVVVILGTLKVLQDFNLIDFVKLSAFLFLLLILLVFLVASVFLETGRIDKKQWYKITIDKVLSGPLALIDRLRGRNIDRKRNGADHGDV